MPGAEPVAVRMKPVEEWRAVPNHEGAYEVSSFGRVRSLDRTITQESRHGRTYVSQKPGRTLRPGPCASGHLAFIGPRPDGLEVRPLHGDPTNNHASNLVWGTRSENGRDKRYHTPARNWVLSDQDVREIKVALAKHRYGVSRRLASRYGVTECTISAIRHGRLHALLP